MENYLLFQEKQFIKFEEILELMDLNINSINELILNKYGKYSHGYFIKKIKDNINKEDFIFHSEIEAILDDLMDNSFKNNFIVEYSILQEDIANDDTLQRCFEIEKEIKILQNSINEKSSIDDKNSIDKSIFFLQKEYNDKQLIMSLRSTNYYENKKMYAQK